MNLPAHGTASPDPSKHHCQLKTTHQKAKGNSVSAWLGPRAARRNCSRPPGGIHSPPGASVLPDPLFSRHRLAEHTVPPGACSVQYSHMLSLPPGGFVSPPGAIPEQYFTGFSTSTSLLVTYSLL